MNRVQISHLKKPHIRLHTFGSRRRMWWAELFQPEDPYFVTKVPAQTTARAAINRAANLIGYA